MKGKVAKTVEFYCSIEETPKSVDDYLLENVTKYHARPQKGQYLSKHCYRDPKASQSPDSRFPVCFLKNKRILLNVS